MSEKIFQSKVISWLEKQNAYAVKFNASGISKNGVPDVLVCLNGYFLGLELKTDKGVASALQKYNINQINMMGGISIVLRPFMWEDFKKYTLEFLKGVLPFETYKTTLLYLHLKGKELNNENNKTKGKSTII